MIKLMIGLAACCLALQACCAATEFSDVAGWTQTIQPQTVFVTSADGPEGTAMVLRLLQHSASSSAGEKLRVVAGVQSIDSPESHALLDAGAVVREVAFPIANASSFSDESGVVGWVFVLAPLTSNRREVAVSLIDAAHEAGVEHAILLSVAGTGPSAPASMQDYHAQEEHLSAVWPASKHVTLRTFFYQQNLLLWSNDVQSTGGKLRLPYIKTDDSREDDDCFSPLYEDDVADVVAAFVSGASSCSDPFCGRGGQVLNLTGEFPIMMSPKQFHGSVQNTILTFLGFPLYTFLRCRTSRFVIRKSGLGGHVGTRVPS